MKTLTTLVKREYWEYQRNFLWVPLALGSLIILFSLFATAYGIYHANYPNNPHQAAINILKNNNGNITLDIHTANANQDSNTPKHEITVSALAGALHALAAPFIFLLWLQVFYYFCACLFDDRKDGSALFWQSMPISQTQLIGSKLLMGLLLAPTITWAIVTITGAILVVIVLIASHFFTTFLPLTSFHLLAFFNSAMALLGNLYWQGISFFPFFAWCLFCSAQASKAPLLRALLLPLGWLFLETVFLPIKPLSTFLSDSMNTFFSPFVTGNIAATSHALLGLLAGTAFIYIAAQLRAKGYKFQH
jgi:ABC-2 type transport system permease protein